jgi:TetR/AcrR family transcriptional regulator
MDEPGSQRGLVQDAEMTGERRASPLFRSRQGRVHNAEAARQAILNAAEKIFAEHGFDGARVDAIAVESGYNKSLLFQYFGDKLGLYTEVNRRIDQELNRFAVGAMAPFLEDETIATDPRQFRAMLETMVGVLFDVLLTHPHVVRIIIWEQAEGWQTYTKIMSAFDTSDVDQLRAAFNNARRAGWLRSDFDPFIQLVLAEELCWTYLTSIPLYQMFTNEDMSSSVALQRAKKYLVDFIVHGMMVDPQDNKD